MDKYQIYLVSHTRRNISTTDHVRHKAQNERSLVKTVKTVHTKTYLRHIEMLLKGLFIDGLPETS